MGRETKHGLPAYKKLESNDERDFSSKNMKRASVFGLMLLIFMQRIMGKA
jgi:hypothetical protein